MQNTMIFKVTFVALHVLYHNKCYVYIHWLFPGGLILTLYFHSHLPSILKSFGSVWVTVCRMLFKWQQPHCHMHHDQFTSLQVHTKTLKSNLAFVIITVRIIRMIYICYHYSYILFWWTNSVPTFRNHWYYK